MPEATQTKTTKIMKIILWMGIGLTIMTGILSFISGGADTQTGQNDSYQSEEANPFK